MEMISAELLSSWGRGRASTVCGCLSRGIWVARKTV